jgi:UDP-3-O-[3-hydroxymyristoyl] glucosamine N-acyltransferase
MRHWLNEPVSSDWLAAQLGLVHEGEAAEIRAVVPLREAAGGDLVFSRDAGAEPGEGVTLICPASGKTGSAAAIVAPNPRLSFIKALLALDSAVGFRRDSSDPVIDPTASIGRNVVIEAGVRIGAGTRVGHGVVLLSGTSIGRDCVIGANTVIGGTGFGFERDEDGQAIAFLHLGGVVLEDEVEIGALTAIDRGALDNTVIGGGSKIDNLIHIAHNAVIGEDCLVIAGAEISGGVRLGRRVWIGPNACVINGVEVGEGATVGLGAVVVKPVQPGATVAGNPAEELGLFVRKRAAVSSLLK